MEANLREWLKKNYGIQDYIAYRNTQTEEFIVRYLADYKISLRQAIEKKIKKLRNGKYKFRNMSAEDNHAANHLEEILTLLDTVQPK